MKDEQQDSTRSIIFWIIKTVIISLMMMSIIPIIFSVNFYNVNIKNYQDEMSNYPYEEYNYLIEASKDMFKEKEIMDFSVKTEDVIMDMEDKQENGYICKFKLNKGKEDKFIPDISVIVQLSKDFEILSFNYLSDEEYAQVIKNSIKDRCLDYTQCVILLETLIVVIILVKVA